MHDKRKVRRRHVLYYLRLFDADSGQPVGDLHDITPEGIMIVGSRAFSPGEEFRLRLNLPREMFRIHEFEFSARCIWCRYDETASNFRMGFSVVNAESTELETIVNLITELGDPE